jgi:hypothetical protein
MNTYFNKFFTREHLTTNEEIISWWNKGRGLLNLVFIIYVLIHLTIIVLVFENGWILFLLPIIGIAALVINIIFSFGLVFELIAIRIFKLKINFDKAAPDIKILGFILSGLFILFLSLYDMLILN